MFRNRSPSRVSPEISIMTEGAFVKDDTNFLNPSVPVPMPTKENDGEQPSVASTVASLPTPVSGITWHMSSCCL